jgi:hypothetical protein
LKSRNFILSPVIYVLVAGGILAEVLLFLPDSSRGYAAAPGFSSLVTLASDIAVLAVLALIITTVVSIRGSDVVLRICGVSTAKTPIPTIVSLTTGFPFMTLQREGVDQKKPRFCPSLLSHRQFLDALLAVNPAISIEAPGKKPLAK